MAFNPKHLVIRDPILDRNRTIAFFRMASATAEYEFIMPFLKELANIQTPQALYFIPMAWVLDNLLLPFTKLTRDAILVIPPGAVADSVTEYARGAGFKIATWLEQGDARESGCDYTFVTLGADVVPSPSTIYTGVNTPVDEARAKASDAMYFSGSYSMAASLPVAGGKRINPSQALILELIGVVQQEAESRTIEAMFQRDVTLSFKLLRYINSPGFGLLSPVKSLRHAISVIGYQQLLKWLMLLAVTAGRNSAPVLTQTALVRARHMELIGAKVLDKQEADNLFIIGMLSLLDHIMGVPMEDLLQRVNFPPTITETLTQEDGKYQRFLFLAQACEGSALREDIPLDDIDARAVNLAHLEAIEWATQLWRMSLS